RGKIIELSGRINGKINDIIVRNFHIKESPTTAFHFDAHITGLPKVQSAVYAIKINSFETRQTDIASLLPGYAFPVSIPDRIKLEGKFNGSFSNFNTSF